MQVYTWRLYQIIDKKAHPLMGKTAAVTNEWLKTQQEIKVNILRFVPTERSRFEALQHKDRYDASTSLLRCATVKTSYVRIGCLRPSAL